MPALLIITSRRPKSRTTASSVLDTSSSRVTLQRYVRQRTDSASHSSRVRSRSAWLRSSSARSARLLREGERHGPADSAAGAGDDDELSSPAAWLTSKDAGCVSQKGLLRPADASRGLRRSRNADSPSRPSGLTRRRASSRAVSSPSASRSPSLRHAAHELLRCAQRFRSAAQQVIDLRRDGRVELLCSRREVQQADAARFDVHRTAPRSGTGGARVDCRSPRRRTARWPPARCRAALRSARTSRSPRRWRCPRRRPGRRRRRTRCR